MKKKIIKRVIIALLLVSAKVFAIPTVAIGEIILATTPSNTAVLNLQLTKTDDLLSGIWSNAGPAVRWEVPMAGAAFYKVQAQGEQEMAYTLTYTTIDATTTSLTGYTGTPVDVVIPEIADGGRTVVSIGDLTFYNETSLVYVSIPGSVNNLSLGCFYGCSSLDVIKMNGDAPVVGVIAFKYVPGTVRYPSTATGYTNPWGNLTALPYVSGAFNGLGAWSGSIAMGDPAWAILNAAEIEASVESAATWPPSDFGDGITTDLGQTITLDLQGGTGETTHYTFESTYGEFPTVTRHAYLFSGWFTGALGTGTRVYSDTTLVVPDDDDTLYAKWISYMAGNVSSGKGMLSHFAIGIGTDIFSAPIAPPACAERLRSNCSTYSGGSFWMIRKTYHRRVFGGKDAKWDGIDQGKADLYPDTVNMALNVTFNDNLFKTREGQGVDDLEVTGSIHSAINTQNTVAVCAGTDIYAEVT